jgi:tRNA-modifying protein YgfZ
VTLRFIDSSDRARVLLRGKDARSFLHRMSTQHVKDLAAGQGRLNVLLTDKGRIVDLVRHLDLGERGVLLIGSKGRGETIRAWLDRYLFSEDVELTDVSAQGGALDVTGPPSPDAAALAPFSFLERDGVVVVRDFEPWFLVVSLERMPAVTGEPMTRADAEALRIAAMAPGDAELIDKFNPLDLGLAFEPHGAVHWDKGCYIGQEVVARLDTYAKQQRALFGIVVDPSGLAPGAAVMADGAQLGELTSVSPVHNQERPSALAVLKLKEPRDVVVRAPDGVERTARAVRFMAPHGSG